MSEHSENIVRPHLSEPGHGRGTPARLRTDDVPGDTIAQLRVSPDRS